MATWADYKGKPPNEKKQVKIIIHGSAKHYEKLPEEHQSDVVVDFDNFVNTIFETHREQLNELFNSVYGLEGNSVDKEFSFDSVEKQIR